MTIDFGFQTSLQQQIQNISSSMMANNYATNMLNNNFYSSIFNQAYNIAQVSNVGMNGQYGMDTSLSTPLWMQQLNNPLNMQTAGTQYDFTDMFKFQPAVTSTSTTQTGATAQTGTTVTTQNSAVTNPFAVTTQTQQQTAQQSQLAQQLNQYGISTTGDEAKDKKALAAAKAKQDKIDDQAAQIAEELYDAMKGAGTKNDKLVNAVNKITKDNILYVLEAWNTNFADCMDGESLLQSIQGEHHTGWFGHQQEDIENKLTSVLVEKAKDLGLNNEGHAARAKINSEHDAWFTSDETVLTAFETLVSQVATKDAQVRQEKYTKATQGNK